MTGRIAALGVLVLLLAPAASAQPPQAPPPPDPDRRVDPAQPDFVLAALPTTLRAPTGRLAFRVTHRFTRALNEGDVGELLENAFGLDSSAMVGLELRYGLRPGTQIGIHRTSDRTIQIFGKHNVLNPNDGAPIGVDLLATVEGSENLGEEHRSVVGVLLSHVAERAGVYVEPMVVFNNNQGTIGSAHTLLLGLGARLRLGERGYLVGEFAPRVAGHTPGAHQISVAIERRTGGHMFQLNVSNGFGTTLGQLAHGVPDYEKWYLGFHIARRF